MKIFNFLKTNFRLVAFFGGMLVLTIFLLATTQIEEQKTISQPNPVTEPSDEEEEVEEETQVEENEELEEIPQIDMDDFEPEKRLSYFPDETTEIDGHRLLTENEDLQLFFQRETLSMIIREKKNGKVMYSTVQTPQGGNASWSNFMRSPIVINYITENNTGFNQLDLYSGNPEIAVNETLTGFEAELFFPEQEIGMLVKVDLTNDGVVVELPDHTIREESSRFTIGEVFLYPFMGYTFMDNEAGYMFIPDGSGSLIYLEDNNEQYSQPFSQPFYDIDLGVDIPKSQSMVNDMAMLNNAKPMYAPIWGMVHTENEIGYLATIESGDENGTLQAYPNGAILPYNWITTKFRYRSVYSQATSRSEGSVMILQQNRNEVNAKISYRFVSGDQADYFGLSQTYRQYLIDNHFINETSSDRLMRIDLFGADSEKSLVSNKIVEMTSFAEMGEILERLYQNDVTRIDVGIRGWQAGGEYGSLGLNRFRAENKLGGNRGLNELLEKSQEHFDLFLYNDLLLFNPSTRNSVRYDLFTRLNKQLYRESIASPVFPELNYVIPEQSQKMLRDFSNQDEKNHPAGVVITGISNKLFSYSYKGENFDRHHALSLYEEIFEEASQTSRLFLDNPFQAYWKYAEALIDFPIRSNNYIFESQEIPFFGLALNNLIPLYAPYFNFEENRDAYFLKLLESGIRPSFLITEEDSRALQYTSSAEIYSSKYTVFEREILEMYTKLAEVQEQIAGASISQHTTQGTVVDIRYENGIRLLLNKGEAASSYDGHSLEAYAYKVVRE
ncbi:hypothetical protein A5867_003184 [Enterococcus sp. 6D12_DIV0197]|uniref:DUF5696 domain-containing protein n=1 Tax=Enterococcus TaxID=1350 RepID=UPI000B3E9715|nr:DUF5696 domain-containing protein [Enterococcus sp. 6D12_DIV0197]OUZ25476.1 hypothetical protein A5867_003184 [Enterococcus sp. 6D12_DIV0197]